MNDLLGLPAGPRAELALSDLSRGRWTLRAYWLAAAASRLRDLGLPIPLGAIPPEEPEMALYAALCDEVGNDAYYRYNSMRQELASFISALEARRRRADSQT